MSLIFFLFFKKKNSLLKFSLFLFSKSGKFFYSVMKKDFHKILCFIKIILNDALYHLSLENLGEIVDVYEVYLLTVQSC